ncbi:MAG TPA: hypothetical protein VNX87_10455 [Candidatus Sulfotelmatobacter sp.]|jgi:hypothetical protein|nr:hypothetical protein [Candidatus Sulfotelmatobacter sp.]
MASLLQHNDDCRRFLGESFENVNKWMDEYFAQYGPTHRRFRHHREGIEQARELFGARGAVAAAIHILRDCRHIPRREDYDLGHVDALGLKANWSVASYIKYSQEDFESMVEQLLRPSGSVLWSFMDQADVQILLSSLTRLDAKQIEQLIAGWQQTTAKRTALPPTPNLYSPAPIENPDVLQYLRELEEKHPTFKDIAPGKEVSVNLVQLSQLVNPLVLIDYELLDSLKPELPLIDEIHIARFALPQEVRIPIKAMLDPTMRNAMFVSNDKTMTVSPARVQQTPLGTAVTFLVGASGSALIAANYSGRLILRNGIHRAVLLAMMGVKSAPCIVVKEDGPVVAAATTAFPTFTDAVLSLPRPPIVMDFLNQDLILQVPLQRTHKLVKISAEETIVPID